MINLSSEPSLGSMVITTGGVWKYTYLLQRGMVFPDDTEASVVVTDRAGVQLGVFAGVLGDDKDRINFLVQPGDLQYVEAGSNWELFITMDDGVYKVRYGRVVRREPSYPLVSSTSFDPFSEAIYVDNLDRSVLGPRWVTKYGATAMHPHDGGNPAYLMGVRSIDFFLPLTLWEDSAVLWYAPTKTDTFEIKIKLWAGGNAKTTIALSSNYAMTSYLGVMFDGTGTDAVRVVTGSGPITTSNQSAWTHTVGNADPYVIHYTLSTNTVEVWADTAATGSPDLSWTDSTHAVAHGEGHRYVGASWQSSFAATGPLIGAWSVEDI